VIAKHPTNGRIVTACGRAFEYSQSSAQPVDRRCFACQRRTGRSQYLIPSGAALEKLLDTPQLHLFDLPLLRPSPKRARIFEFKQRRKA
jgi:hypothetical protein